MLKTKAGLILLIAVAAASTLQAQRAKLSKAAQDPFVSSAPPLAKTSKLTTTMAPALAPEAAPLLKAPDLGLQYAGKMTTPSGEKQVFAVERGQLMALKVGMVMASGYIVQAIEPKAVRFHDPVTNTTARLSLPSAPAFELR